MDEIAVIKITVYIVCHFFQWLRGSVIRALDSGPRNREFDSLPVRYQVTTLSEFEYLCLCRCTWCSGYRGSFASNLE